MAKEDGSLSPAFSGVQFVPVTVRVEGKMSAERRFSNREGQVSGTSASDGAKQNGQLKKEFGFFSLVAFLFGGMVGSGIFVSPAFVLRRLECGGVALITWFIAGVIALLGGLCYAELGSFVRNAGGEFAFIHKAFSYNGKQPYKVIGELLAFSAVWTQVVILRPASLTIVLLTFAEYTVKPFFSSHNTSTAFLKVSIAWVAMLCLAFVNAYSSKGVVRVAEWLSTVKFLALWFIILVGLSKLFTGNLLVFASHMAAGYSIDASTFFVALYAANWAYEGWSGPAFVIEEVKDIAGVPLATALSVFLVCACYMLVNCAYMAALEPGEIEGLDVAIAIPATKKVIGSLALVIVPILVAISTFGAAHGTVYTASRLLFSAARSGYLPEAISGLHSKHSTPIPALALLVVLSTVYIMAGDISDLISSFNASIWTYYCLSFISLLIMRVTCRHEPRPFKVWTAIPALMVFISLAILIVPLKEQWTQSLGAFGVISLSVPVYFVFVCEKTRLRIFGGMSQYLTKVVSLVFSTVPCADTNID